jgi:hypothetical protein
LAAVEKEPQLWKAGYCGYYGDSALNFTYRCPMRASWAEAIRSEKQLIATCVIRKRVDGGQLTMFQSACDHRSRPAVRRDFRKTTSPRRRTCQNSSPESQAVGREETCNTEPKR